MRLFALMALLFAAAGASARAFQEQEEKKEIARLLDEIESSIKTKKYAEAIALAKKAMELDAKNPAIHYGAGTAHLALRQNAEAAKAFTRVLELEPMFAPARDRRGDAYLKQGEFTKAIADFDKYLEAQPNHKPDHWRRGIALYYAGKFDEGRKQFDLHRTVNPEDVENSAWHYLCNARANSPKKAREDLIPVSKDTRVPMKQVLELFAGKLKPQDVLDAAENAMLKGEALTEARFYANQYVALYYESEGNTKKALEHLTTAVEKYKIGHYMWDVGAAHLDMLKARKK